MSYKKIAEVKFDAVIVYEYSISPKPIEQGMASNTMELYISEDEESGYIDWDIEYKDCNGEGETVNMGLQLDGKVVTGYDGVFELPEEALKLLTDNGFDISEL